VRSHQDIGMPSGQPSFWHIQDGALDFFVCDRGPLQEIDGFVECGGSAVAFCSVSRGSQLLLGGHAIDEFVVDYSARIRPGGLAGLRDAVNRRKRTQSEFLRIPNIRRVARVPERTFVDPTVERNVAVDLDHPGFSCPTVFLVGGVAVGRHWWWLESFDEMAASGFSNCRIEFTHHGNVLHSSTYTAR
jgi:hypothetical protein